ncbi:MAG: hypothetical protein AB7P17_14515, partial [Nitrospirales bacterium]
PIETIPQKTMDRLIHYHWPGNVRELENPVEQTVLLSQGPELIVDLGLPKHNLSKPFRQSPPQRSLNANTSYGHCGHANEFLEVPQVQPCVWG